MAYLSTNQISVELACKVKQSIRQQHFVAGKGVSDEDELFAILPVALKRSLFQAARGPRLCRHLIWHALDRGFQRCFERMCVDLLRSHTYIPDSEVFSCGESAIKVVILDRGTLEYI